MSKSRSSAGHPSEDLSEKKSLIDNHGRPITYLRLAITDRCNLRCRYCMPEAGVPTVKHEQTLSYEELERLVKLFQDLGISKIRITGGEPFVRKGCISFMKKLRCDLGIEQLYLTTNGVETHHYLKEMKEFGISGINLSLDTLNRKRFTELTRRDCLDDVLHTLNQCLELNIPLKVNSVVMEDTSDDDIKELVELVRENRLSLRFIEQMGFSGTAARKHHEERSLKDRLHSIFPTLEEIPDPSMSSTAREYNLPGYVGRVGIIEGHSRRFCSTCNKIRITPEGMLKACLYDNGVLDLRMLLRAGMSDHQLSIQIRECLNNRFSDGHETEAVNGRSLQPSMASIGG